MSDIINFMPIPVPSLGADFVKAQDELYKTLALAITVPESATIATHGSYSVMASYDAFREAVAEVSKVNAFRYLNRRYPDPILCLSTTAE